MLLLDPMQQGRDAGSEAFLIRKEPDAERDVKVLHTTATSL